MVNPFFSSCCSLRIYQRYEEIELFREINESCYVWKIKDTFCVFDMAKNAALNGNVRIVNALPIFNLTIHNYIVK